MEKPCKQCPWIQKGQPDITPELQKTNNEGQWFCCHVNLGTCHGAENSKIKSYDKTK